MFSKKHIALFVSIVLGVSALAGCGAKDSADVTEAEASEDISAALTESETEQTEEAAVITETELTEETETASEIETDEGVTETEAEEPPEEPPVNITNSVNADDVPSLADTVPFTYINFEVNPQNDEVPEELVSSARQVLADNERYNEFIGYDPDNSEVQLTMFEDYLVDGVPQAKVYSSLYKDFDGDGSEEAFIMFGLPLYFGEIGQPEGGNCLGVFVNADSEARLIYQGYGCFEGELVYDGFTHLFISGGMNNASLRTEIFSVKDGKAVKEYSYPWAIEIDDENNFMYETAQVPLEVYNALMWDSDKGCYVNFDLPESAIEW